LLRRSRFLVSAAVYQFWFNRNDMIRYYDMIYTIFMIFWIIFFGFNQINPDWCIYFTGQQLILNIIKVILIQI